MLADKCMSEQLWNFPYGAHLCVFKNKNDMASLIGENWLE